MNLRIVHRLIFVCGTATTSMTVSLVASAQSTVSTAPQVTAPQVTAPQVTAPQVTAPQVTAPQVTAPQVTAPQVTAPHSSAARPATTQSAHPASATSAIDVSQPPPSGSTGAPLNVSPPAPTWSTCRESVPEGKTRPSFEEQFPGQVPAGHAAVLKVTLTHGKGERVLADAFELQRDSDGARALRQSGFEFPSTVGPAAPRVSRTERESDAVTVVELSVLPLPKAPGPHPLTLPPLPIAVARASGEVITLCTSPHGVTVTDPTANVPNAQPRRHPGGERQRELWTALRNVTYGALLGLVLAALIALLVRWYKRRPKVAPPPAPPRPAWEVALEALTDLRHSDLLSRGQFTTHLERVNHVLRQYLGGRYGFEGLESTTEEVLGALRASSLPTTLFAQTEHMLRESDLVKFAKLVPTEAQCKTALDDVEGLVRQTMHSADPVNPEPRAPMNVVVSAPLRNASSAQGPLIIAEAPGRQSASTVTATAPTQTLSTELQRSVPSETPSTARTAEDVSATSDGSGATGDSTPKEGSS